jgi:hypothetical protein
MEAAALPNGMALGLLSGGKVVVGLLDAMEGLTCSCLVD